jgi:alkanesulfonate monooxygenase SsuD/methylene tetrahydromethanopterin reductase-like flavin-dependent oxidoreductase (luciferase family)
MCAPTPEEAQWHASSLDVARLQMARGQGGSGIIPPEEAARHVFTPEERHFLAHSGMRASVGDPRQVAEQLDEIAQRYATDQLGIVTICYDFGARRRSYELVAAECIG